MGEVKFDETGFDVNVIITQEDMHCLIDLCFKHEDTTSRNTQSKVCCDEK